jgi:hypothetical protein
MIISVLTATKALYGNSYITLQTRKYNNIQTYWFRLCELVAVNEFDRFWFSCMNFYCIFMRIWDKNCCMNSFPILTVCYCITTFTSQWEPWILKNKLPMTTMQKTISWSQFTILYLYEYMKRIWKMDSHVITVHKDKNFLQIQWIFLYHEYVKEQSHTPATIIMHVILYFWLHYWYADSLVTLLK